MRHLALVSALLAALLAAVPAEAAHQRRKPRPPVCNPHGFKVLGQANGLRLFYVQGADDGEYGAPAKVYGCVLARRKRVLLLNYDATAGWAISDVQLLGRYAAFLVRTDNVACEKYQAGGCQSASVMSFDVVTGKRRALSASDASALALTSAGWIAWFDGKTLWGLDSSGQRTLDSGNVDPASLHATGATVSWTKDGAPASADLR
jgi:hypothetical protein